MFKNFIKFLIGNHFSLIINLFFGFKYNFIECLDYGNRTFKFQNFIYLVFPLVKIRGFKNNIDVISNINKNNEINLIDCLEYDQRKIKLTDNNRPYFDKM